MVVVDLITPDPGRIEDFFFALSLFRSWVETHKHLIYPRACRNPLYIFLHNLRFTFVFGYVTEKAFYSKKYSHYSFVEVFNR
jgi:hypothetical protein